MKVRRGSGPPPITGSERQSMITERLLEVFMSENVAASAPGTSRWIALDAHKDSRALVRLVQCPRCSKPFKTPVTLPCSHSLCRECLPSPHLRQNISYPNTADRQRGIKCPAPECSQEHSLADVNIDVTFSKVMHCINDVVDTYRSVSEITPTFLEEVINWEELKASGREISPILPRSRTIHGGRLLATFLMAEAGDLDYSSNLVYRPMFDVGDSYSANDEALLRRLRESVHKELDCHVCYNTMYDPVTTGCGHTFCRKCLIRVLDHADLCPICRRKLHIPPSLERQSSNTRIVSLLLSLCPELVAARAEAVEQEERGTDGQLDVPLFLCTLSFPTMPTFLHIFEPRYRLMIRRAAEGNGQFGMLLYNRSGTPQGEMGITQFLEYGTMLQIMNVQMLPDGRSLVETRGLYRFRVTAHGLRDGYTVGNIERVEDVSLAEEECLEAGETSFSAPTTGRSNSFSYRHIISRDFASADFAAQVNRLSTQQLLMIGAEFITKMRANSAPWLHQRILAAYGGPPDDPALFPYWFACVLPIGDDEKYQLLRTTSVRQRLKIIVTWIRRIEEQRWYTGGSCVLL